MADPTGIVLAHIVAASENGVIGRAGDLPWRIPEDMRFFMRTTKGHIVIMGRKTFESMPKPLPDRLNVVITRQASFVAPAGVVVVPDVAAALAYAREHAGANTPWGREVYVAGGGEIYRETLGVVDRILLTVVHAKVEGDTTYPAVPQPPFREIGRTRHENEPPFSFVTYERT
jgi:dihydrofolate reductase